MRAVRMGMAAALLMIVTVETPAEESRVRVMRELLVRRGGGGAESEAAVAAGLDWLARHQAADGHWSLDAPPNDVAATALGVLPFLGAGITHKSQGDDKAHARRVELGLKWLMNKMTKEGDFGGGMYAHGLAAMALCHAYALTADPALKGAAQKSLDYIVAAQHAGGGWRYQPGQPGDTSVTGWQLQALWLGQTAGLDVPKAVFEKATKYLDGCRTREGGYGYVGPQNPSPTMTAAGLLGRHLLGTADDQLGPAADPLRKTAPGSLNSVYHDYYATQACFLVGGHDWQDWNAGTRDRVVKRQDTKGDDRGSWPPGGDPLGQVGRVYTTSMALMTLEAYYRLDLILEARASGGVTAKEAEALWDELTKSGLAARRGVWSLVKSPRTAAALIREKLKPAEAINGNDSRRIAALIRELDSDEFATRDRASAELERFGGKAEGALRSVLQDKPPAEVRRRATRLLETWEATVQTERARESRLLDVLELGGGSEGREVLESLAKGDAEAWLTRNAKAALDRLARRSGSRP